MIKMVNKVEHTHVLLKNSVKNRNKVPLPGITNIKLCMCFH